MSKLLVGENPMMVVWVYPERRMIHHVMKTYCHGPDFREALSKGARDEAPRGDEVALRRPGRRRA